MEVNKLYFVKDEYFENCEVDTIPKNKESDSISEHNRPCYCAFENEGVYWMIPISSQVDKYKNIYQKTVSKYGFCDTISFVHIKGNENVVLIQNMIPVTQNHINNIYMYADTNNPIEINKNKQKEINAKTRKVLRMARNGKQLTFTPILELEQKILTEQKDTN